MQQRHRTAAIAAGPNLAAVGIEEPHPEIVGLAGFEQDELADLIEHKKAPLLGDVRDESAEDIRLVIEPKSRTVEPEVLMESLFKLSDLEIRFPINMNVLDAAGTPRVMGLKACLQAFLDHRREVLVRRSEFRLDKIEKRLHILEGFLKAWGDAA